MEEPLHVAADLQETVMSDPPAPISLHIHQPLAWQRLLQMTSDWKK